MTTSPKLLPIHNRFDISFSHGEGVYVYASKDQKKYLDFGAGIAVNALGHCHPKMVEAITSQANKLWHVSNMYDGDELNTYAEKLVNATFADYAFFCNSGAESIECAIKMIRRHFYIKKQPQKNRIITFTGAFHGRTMATISAASNPKYIQGFEPALPGFDNVEFGNIEAVKNAINANTAGILIEPIQGEQGIRVSDKAFIQELRNLANQHDLLLAFDEVQCGMGRTGNLFAYELYNVKPDIIATAKAIGGGFPLGACLATKNAASGMEVGTHGTTYGGNPLAMAVAESVLDVMLNDGFLDNVKKMSAELKAVMHDLQNQFPHIIDDVRGLGLMLGMKINPKFVNIDITKKMIENGFLTIPAGENVIRLLPPLILSSENILEAKEKMITSFKELS